MKLHMSSALLIFLLGLLTMGHAHATPSVSSDAGQSTDKSLSADKSRGNRSTHADGAEKAAEKSLSQSHQDQTGGSSRDKSAMLIFLLGLLAALVP